MPSPCPEATLQLQPEVHHDLVPAQVQLQYNYAPTTFVSLCKPVAAEFVTDAELEGPLGHVVDAFPNIQRSLVKLVYVQSRYDVQETIERLMDLNIEADTMQLQACPTPPRQPSALDSPDGQSQGPAKAVQSVSRVKACEESRHSIATLQKQGSHPGLPCAHSSPPVDAKAPSGIFTASRAFWPCWSGGEPPDRQTHQMYVLTDILPAQTAQAPSTPAFGGLAGFDASPCLTPQGSGSHVGPLPAAVVAAASSTSASPDRPSLGLQAYQAPPPPVARLAPEAVPEADLPTEEQSMEFLQGMFPDLGLAVVEDAFLTAERDVDAAMCHLMQMQMKVPPPSAVAALQSARVCPSHACLFLTRTSPAWGPCRACQTPHRPLTMEQTLPCPLGPSPAWALAQPPPTTTLPQRTLTTPSGCGLAASLRVLSVHCHHARIAGRVGRSQLCATRQSGHGAELA